LKSLATPPLIDEVAIRLDVLTHPVAIGQPFGQVRGGYVRKGDDLARQKALRRRFDGRPLKKLVQIAQA
jgi:hypothetical protein